MRFISCSDSTADGRSGIKKNKRKIYSHIDDYINRRNFDDEIARNSYWLDCHPSGNDKSACSVQPDNGYKIGDSHGIPFRCLVPENVRNLLVAGRCISVERIVLASTRVMPNCLATGEAAGIGSALAIKENTDVCNINGKSIKEFIESNKHI